MTRSGRPTRKANVWLRQSETENVVYDPDSGAVHMLNATAMAIWVLCDGQTDPDEMVDAICELSGLPPEVIAEDVRRILLQFEEADILTWRE
ncbi:MAG: HPr-rel-A system PqqD family peptide chaperone [Actinomycetota bacterium]